MSESIDKIPRPSPAVKPKTEECAEGERTAPRGPADAIDGRIDAAPASVSIRRIATRVRAESGIASRGSCATCGKSYVSKVYRRSYADGVGGSGHTMMIRRAHSPPRLLAVANRSIISVMDPVPQQANRVRADGKPGARILYPLPVRQSSSAPSPSFPHLTHLV